MIFFFFVSSLSKDEFVALLSAIAEGAKFKFGDRQINLSS